MVYNIILYIFGGRIVNGCRYWLDLDQSVSQCCQVSLSSLLPDWINLLFYLRDLLFVLPSLVVWDHGSEFVNLLLVLPVYQKEEKVSQYMCLHCIVVKTDGQIWNLLAENDLFFFYCFVLASSHDECWMCVSAVSVFEVVWLLSLFRFYGKRSFWFLDWWCFPSWSRWHPFSNSIYLTPNFLRSCSMDLPRLVGNVLAEIRLPWIWEISNSDNYIEHLDNIWQLPPGTCLEANSAGKKIPFWSQPVEAFVW